MRLARLPIILLVAVMGLGALPLRAEPPAGDVQLGSGIELSVVKGRPAAAASIRRVGVFLVDCSSSMAGDAGGMLSTAKPSRWSMVREGLDRSLRDLQQVVPGIEVRLAFFAGGMNVLPPARATLSTPGDVATLMTNVPVSPPKRGATHLYEAIAREARSLLEEHARAAIDWALFAVLSDGADETSADAFQKGGPKGYDRALADLTTGMQATTLQALIVGDDVKKFASAGGFGALSVDAIDKSRITPPPPLERFTAEMPREPAGSTHGLARAGTYAIPVRIAYPAGAVPGGLAIKAFLEPGSPFSLEPGTDVQVLQEGSGEAWVRLRLPSGADTSAGLQFVLRLELASADGGKAVIAATPVRVAFAFAGSETLAPERWTVTPAAPMAVRLGTAATAAVSAGKLVGNPEWEFLRDGSAERERDGGASITHTFGAPGRWRGTVHVTADTGTKATKKDAVVFDVVDADFAFAAPASKMVAGQELAVEIKPGPSEASYTAIVNGVVADAGSRAVRIRGLDQVGTHVLRVTARSKVGNYEWTREHMVTVEPAPALAILGPHEFSEGAQQVDLSVRMAGDLGPSMELLVDGVPVGTFPAVYKDPALKVAQASIPLPLSRLRKASARLELRAAGAAGSMDLEGQPADIHVRLGRPVDGSSVRADGTEEVEVGLEGAGASTVGDVVVNMRLAPAQGPAVDLVASASSGYKVAVPEGLALGELSVHAQLSGGLLQTDIFPREWKLIGKLTVSALKLSLSVAPPGSPRLGVPCTFTVTGADPGKVAGVEWIIDGAASRAAGGAGLTSPSVTPRAWGKVNVVARVSTPAGVQSVEQAFPIGATSPSAQPAFTKTTTTEGDPSVGLNPGLNGDFTAARFALYERGGKAAGKDPLWTSEPFAPAALPKEIEVPLGPPALKQAVPPAYEVWSEVSSYAGDPRPFMPVPIEGRQVPKKQWIPWILCCVALLLACWALAHLLLNNEPTQWDIEVTSVDPGFPPNRPEAPDRDTIPVAQPAEPPAGARAYTGWSRRHKRAHIPLWLLATSGRQECAWMSTSRYANVTLELTRRWQTPLAQPPGHQGPVSSMRLHSHHEDGHDRWSETRVLEADPEGIGRPAPKCYVRVRCPHGQDPLVLKVLVPFVVGSIVAAAVLAYQFHIV